MNVAIRALCGGLVAMLLSTAPGFETSAASTPAAPTPAAAAAPAAEDRSGEAWTRAMALSNQQRYDEALAEIWRALDRDPANTELLWLEAGILGWAGRHDASVLHYERLLAGHPEMVDQLRLDLGTQRLWAGDPSGALRDAETELAANPTNERAKRLRALALAHADRYRESLEAYDALLKESPDDVDLQLDRAMILGWMGKNGRAVDAYADILDKHPQETRALFGLAQNENWRGNHGKAVRLFEEMLAASQADPDALIGLAYANYWADRPEAARTALAQLTTVRRQERDARQLSMLLLFEEAQVLTGGFEASDDSDDLRIKTWTLDYRLPLPGRSAFLLFVRDDDARDQGGTEDPVRFGAGFETRWRARWKAAARVFYFDPRSDLPKRLLGQASMSYRAGDRFQYDFGIEVEPVLTRRSLALGIRSTNGNAAVSWRAGDRVTVTAGAQYRDYTDGNQAMLTSAAARWELPSRHKSHLALTFGANLLRTDKDLDNGYYDPEWNLELGPGAQWSIDLPRRATLGLGARTGYQWAKGGGGDPFYKLEARAQFPLGQALRLTLQAERGNSTFGSQSGFKRTGVAIFLTTAF